MLDFNEPAVAASFPTGIGNPTVAHRSDRSSPFGDKVYSMVGAPDLEDRMQTAMGEGGTDAAKLDGVTKEGTGERLSLAIEISAVTVFLFKIKAKVFFSAGSEFCGQDTEAFFFLSLCPILSLIEDSEGISLPYIDLKIYVPAKDIYELGEDLRVQAQPLSTLIKRVRNGPSNRFDLHLVGSLLFSKDNPLVSEFPI